MGVAFAPVTLILVFGLVLAAGILFWTRWIPVETTALAVAVSLALLEPWTRVSPLEAISGFSSPATITVLAMFILSEGVRRTGVLGRLARRLATLSRGSERRQLGIAVGLSGPAGGFVNNTPLVGVLIPVLADLARRNRTSPSLLMLPLSYAAILGGTLTLLGTSSNLLASDLSRRFLDRSIGVFEFTPLGLLVLGTGTLYLLTVGRKLVPERISPDDDLIARFGMGDLLHRLQVRRGSPMVGRTLEESQRGEQWDLDILQIRRGRTIYAGPRTDQSVEAGDVLRVRADPETAAAYARAKRLTSLRHARFTDATLVEAGHTVIELTVAPESILEGETLVSSGFRNRYDATVLALGRGDRLIRERIEDVELRAGDSLLVLLPLTKREVVDDLPGLVVTRTSPMEDLLRPASEEAAPESGRTALTLGIVGAVVGLAGLGLVPIYIAALGGVVLMVAAGSLRAEDAYSAVGWEVIFLLAGLIPLGIAMDRTGAAGLLAELVLAGSGGLPPVAVLALFYLLTVGFTNVIGNNASIVLMIPVALDAAARVGAEPFSFLLAVTFASASPFLSPVAYPTNLMVMGPGGYRFGDYARVGAPLQLLLAVVVPLGIALIWGV